MSTDFRALCAELANALEHLHKQFVTSPHCQVIELSNGRHPIPLGNDILLQDHLTAFLLDRARSALAEPAGCNYPGCVDDSPDQRCSRWLTGECPGPQPGARAALADANPQVDRSDAADAARFRWLLDGNGYFMEEEMLCGHSPCGQREKDQARALIDEARQGNR